MTDDQTLLKLIIFGIPLAWLITALVVGAIDRARRVIDGAPTPDTTGVGDQAEAWLQARDEQVYDWAKDDGSGLT